PHVDAVQARNRPSELGRRLGDLLPGLGEPPGRAEDRQPAVAVAGGPPDGRVALPADDDRDRRARRRLEARGGELEELPLVVDGVPAVADLAPVLTADPGAEHQAPGGQLADRGELACRSSGREAGCAVICDLTR